MPRLGDLGLGRHPLRGERGLDPVEQAFEPAHQLRVRDPELGVRRRAVDLERQRDPTELVDEVGERPSSSSRTERAWISASRARAASSSGALRTSSSSCLTIVPIRMTFVGWSTDEDVSASSSRSAGCAACAG